MIIKNVTTLQDGSFVVMKTSDLEEVARFQHRKKELSDLKFSPNVCQP